MNETVRPNGLPDADAAGCSQRMATIVAQTPAPSLEDLRQGGLVPVCRRGDDQPQAGADETAQPRKGPARLDLPGPALAGCVRAYLSRDTRGLDGPGSPPRINRFPAAPYACIGWFLQGSAVMGLDGSAPEPLPATFFAGPQSRPFSTQDCGPLRSFVLIFYPQALHLMTGLDLAALGNALKPAEGVLPADWMPLLDAVRDATDHEARMAAVQAFVEPRWRAVAPPTPPDWIAPAWVDGLRWSAAQAAGIGSSLRTMERRILRWAGTPMRRLRRLSRAETTLSQARMQADQGQPPPWSEVAAQGGYADQAHLCRETREITGHSPTELARRAGDDESYWLYRIWT